MFWISPHPDHVSMEACPELLIFGHGLVGSAVAQLFARRSSGTQTFYQFSWTNPEARTQDIGILLAALRAKAEAGRKIAFLWSAGSGGFNSPQSIFDGELAAYSDVLALARAAADFSQARDIAFHLVSSAGGLYEGQRFVRAEHPPNPARLYAVAKLKQEELARSELPSGVRVSVYRPSTVYGYSQGGRAGLVLTLIRNGLRYSPIQIFGGLDTLRDYIHVSDVARAIVDEITSLQEKARPMLVAHGKPSSMSEVISLVESVIQRKLMLRIDTSPTNARHNSFIYGSSDLRFSPTSLLTGIRLTFESWAASELYNSRAEKPF